jgi:hypothetical protein
MQTGINKTSYDLRAKPIQVISFLNKTFIFNLISISKTFCNIPKLGKHEHTKTFKIIGNNESQFLLDDKVNRKKKTGLI